MYTPIYRIVRLGAFALGLTALTGCADVQKSFGQLGGGEPAPQVTRVAGDQVVIAGPRGYCIDEASTRDGETLAFVVLARCDALVSRGAKPRDPALLTVAVQRHEGPALPPAKALAAQARSAAGQRSLAGSGQLLATRVNNDVFFAQMRTAPSEGPLEEIHWRAIFGVDGHLVTARVSGFSNNPISADQGFATLNALAQRIKADNAVSEVETISDAEDELSERPPRRFGLFQRIFG